MADKRISELNALTGALNAADAIPISDDSAKATKKISPKALLEKAFLLVDDDSIPASKIDTSGGVTPGSIDTAALADASVTAEKLADNSSGVVGAALPASGVRIGQVALETTNGRFYCWSGSAWVAVKAAGSVNTITTNTGGLLEVTINATDDTVEINVTHADTTGAREFLAGPTAGAGPVSARPIIGDDLPTANASSKGAVEVNGNGLKMEGDLLEIDNSIVPSAGTFNLCDVDANGLVIGYRQISSTDLPLATSSLPGVVKPGVGLVVDDTGTLSQTLVGTPGTYTKVSTDQTGRVVSGSALTPDDIPDGINTNKLTGQIQTDQIADDAITGPKVADYTTCYMQETSPGVGDFLGQLWWQPSTAQLRIYARSSNGLLWMPVGFGVLQQSQLRWGGTYDATTGQITTLTSLGTAAGLEIGAVPPSTEDLTGLYLLCIEGGSNVNQPDVSGEDHTPGDWIVALGDTWVFIDVISGGGGGGGGANKLNDLTDVSVGVNGSPALETSQLFSYDGGTGQWRNVTVIDGGSF